MQNERKEKIYIKKRNANKKKKKKYMFLISFLAFQKLGFDFKAFYKSKIFSKLSISQNVNMFVCVCVCVFTFEVPLQLLFAPTS